jgi:hypothetical protein
MAYNKVCKKIGDQWVHGKVSAITKKKVGRQKNFLKTTYVLQFEDEAQTKIACDFEEASLHAKMYLDTKAVTEEATNEQPEQQGLEEATQNLTEQLRTVGGSLLTKWTVALNEMAGGAYVFNATDEVRIRKGVVVQFHKASVQYELRYKCGLTMYVTVGRMKELIEADRAFRKCRHKKIKVLVQEAENEWNLDGDMGEDQDAKESAMGEPDAKESAKDLPDACFRYLLGHKYNKNDGCFRYLLGHILLGLLLF